MLHGSGKAAIQTSCFCRAKQINVFWRDCVPTGSWEKNCYEASVNPEFGSTVARRLNQSCFPDVLQSNQTTIGGFHVTSSLPRWWTVNKRSLISSLCLSTSICSFLHCYLCLPRLHETHLLSSARQKHDV